MRKAFPGWRHRRCLVSAEPFATPRTVSFMKPSCLAAAALLTLPLLAGCPDFGSGSQCTTADADAAVAATGGTPNYTEHIKPILDPSCNRCHSADYGQSPFLTSYKGAKGQFDASLHQIEIGSMPPSGGPDPMVTCEQREILKLWKATGFAEKPASGGDGSGSNGSGEGSGSNGSGEGSGGQPCANGTAVRDAAIAEVGCTPTWCDVKPIYEVYCNRCHSDGTDAEAFQFPFYNRYATPPNDFDGSAKENTAGDGGAIDRLDIGDMPPPDSAEAAIPLSETTKEIVRLWAETGLTQGACD